MILRSVIPALFLCFLPVGLYGGAPAPAPHAIGQSYLYLSIYSQSVEGRVELTTTDINRALGLSLDTSRGPTQAELDEIINAVRAYVLDHLRIGLNGTWYPIRFTTYEAMEINIADYVLVHFELEGLNEVPDALDIDYNLLFDTDFQHRGLLVIEHNWRTATFENESQASLVFSPGSREQTLDLTKSSVWRGFAGMVWLGVWHIWIGIDHILFLLALVLPSVVRRRNGRWVPVEKFSSALIYVLKIITMFTLAHSVTLSLAALGVVRLPSRLVESVIALSIALAALHNIRPLFKGPDWIIAFVFGLFHGFGFATVLGEIGLRGEFLVLSLLGFNLGVELGQAAIICGIFPVLFVLRRKSYYPKILTYGSLALIVISLYWFIERAFEVDLPAGRVVRWVYNATLGRFL